MIEHDMKWHPDDAADSKDGLDVDTVQVPTFSEMGDERPATEAQLLHQRVEDPNLKSVGFSLDCNLAECSTTVEPQGRRPRRHFLTIGYWRLKYDPNFIVADEKKQVSERQNRFFEAVHSGWHLPK